MQEALVGDFPTVSDLAVLLSITCRNLGDFQSEQGDAEAAAEYLARAINVAKGRSSWTGTLRSREKPWQTPIPCVLSSSAARAASLTL
jgi:hypothetical protein